MKTGLQRAFFRDTMQTQNTHYELIEYYKSNHSRSHRPLYHKHSTPAIFKFLFKKRILIALPSASSAPKMICLPRILLPPLTERLPMVMIFELDTVNLNPNTKLFILFKSYCSNMTQTDRQPQPTDFTTRNIKSGS